MHIYNAYSTIYAYCKIYLLIFMQLCISTMHILQSVHILHTISWYKTQVNGIHTYHNDVVTKWMILTPCIITGYILCSFWLHCGLRTLFKLPCSWIWCFASQRGEHAHLVDHESTFPDVPPELSQPLAVFFCGKGELIVIYNKTCSLENVVSIYAGKPQLSDK